MKGAIGILMRDVVLMIRIPIFSPEGMVKDGAVVDILDYVDKDTLTEGCAVRG